MSLVDAILWKHPDVSGIEIRFIDNTVTIVKFPGGIPSQADQDLWVQEYSDYVAAGGLMDEEANELANPKKAFAAILELLWDNIAELQAAFPNPNGKSKLKQAAIGLYRDKL